MDCGCHERLGHRGVAVDVSVGMNTGLLLPIGIGLGVFGLLLLGGAAVCCTSACGDPRRPKS